MIEQGATGPNARLMQANAHFAGQAPPQGHSLATVASIAVLSSFALTYLLDRYKDKHDKNLRDELKDRVSTSLNDTNKRVNELNQV